MKTLLAIALSFAGVLWCEQAATAQTIKVNPTGVNVNSQSATTAFLTFGTLQKFRPADACWCGELIPAAPDLGFKCNPSTIYGYLPARYDQSALSGNDGFTDIMSIPPSVVRRAYQNAVAGGDASFFYVRRFVSTTGGPDQYVNVTCRMTGGGARVPFDLTDVKLAFATDKPIVFVKNGEKVPKIQAEITYNGTGRLKGRWEVVLPGEEIPTERDLLTEATLPIEERAKQRRYTPLSTFNVFLPPAGRFILPGPETSRLPSTMEGSYLILLRIEATDDKEADSDLSSVGAGVSVVHSGAVAGFPLPFLRYFVGSGEASPVAGNLMLLLPANEAVKRLNEAVDFSWSEIAGAAYYRLEVEDGKSQALLSALLPAGSKTYRAPSWVKDKLSDGVLRWRVLAFNQTATKIGETEWRRLKWMN
jgi:hypothetical protein